MTEYEVVSLPPQPAPVSAAAGPDPVGVAGPAPAPEAAAARCASCSMSLDLAWRFCPACGASSAVTREASSRAEAIASMRPAAPVLSDEQRLIGALMVGGAVALAEVSELQPEQFSDPGCGGVLRALRNVAARRMPTDAYNVWDEYSAYRIRWATIGGRENLERWARSGPQTVSQAVRLVGELGAQTRATGAARLAAEAQERERFRSAMASSRT